MAPWSSAPWPSGGLALEEFLHLGKKARGVRRGLAVALALEFLEQLTLARIQALGCLDLDLDVHVARDLGAQYRHALALEAELLTAFGALRHLDPRLAVVDGGNIDLTAQRRRGHGDRHAAEDVGAIALKELVRLDGQENIKIAGGSTA